MNSLASSATAQLISNQRSIVGRNLIAELHSWEDVQSSIGKGWLIGYVSYEQGLDWLGFSGEQKSDTVLMPKMWFGLFDNVHEDGIPVQTRYIASQQSAVNNWQPNITQPEYTKKFNAVHKHIAAGDIYQANLSYRLSQPANSPDADLFQHLYQKQPANYSAFLQTDDWSVMSFSPERLFSLTGSTIQTEPMKGTSPRGATIPEDESNHNALLSSQKEQAELHMITDIHRNDLAKISQPGSVTVQNSRHIQALPTVWQASSIIQSQLLPGLHAGDVLQAMSPAGSITGAPKLRAAEILYDLEPTYRNIYCGSVGYIAPNGDADFSVAIRTIYRLKDHRQDSLPDMWYYHVGSGVVFDSTAEAEYQETLDKLAFLA